MWPDQLLGDGVAEGIEVLRDAATLTLARARNCSFSCGPVSIPQIGTFLRILLLLRLGLRDLRDQLLGDGVAEGIEVLRDRDERAGAADDVVAIVVCKPAWGWCGWNRSGMAARSR